MNQYCWWETLGNLAFHDVLGSAALAAELETK